MWFLLFDMALSIGYRVTGHKQFLQEPALEYRIYALHLNALHQQNLLLDSTFIPLPQVEERMSHSFRLSIGHKIL
jgi:hypothetical protein